MARNEIIKFLSKVILKGIIFSYIPGSMGLIQQFFSEGVDRAASWSESKEKKEDAIERQLEALFAAKQDCYAEAEYYKSQIEDILTQIKIPLELYLNEAAIPQYLIQEYKKVHQYPENYEQISEFLKYLAPAIAEAGRDAKQFYPQILSDILNAIANHTTQIQAQESDINELKQLVENYRRFESGKYIKDCTLEYKNRWTESMFLHRNSLNMTQITLKNLYNSPSQIPSYTFQNYYRSDMHKVLYDLKKPLLILGQPGIGKSTLITWLLNNNHTQRDILVYRFSDLIFAGWEPGAKKTVGDYLLGNFSYRYKDTEFPLTIEKIENSFLVLDGFDEMAVSGDRVQFLNELYTFWNSTKHFPLVLTCREHYIESDNLYRLQFPYITLQPWNKEQISRFAKDYQYFSGETVSKETIRLARDYNTNQNDYNVFGIPLILYMVLALKIKLETANSIVDVYDRIFQINGGIYDYCVKTDKNLNDSRAYAIDKKTPEEKQKRTLHQMSRDIALWMFENEPERACIPKNNYKEIPHLSNESDLLSASYFNEFKMAHHTDGIESNELRFVHRSMYQYFVAEGFCRQADVILHGLAEEKMTMKYLLSIYFKGNIIDTTIHEYLNYMLKKQYAWKSAEEKRSIYTWWEEQAVKALSEGICYCANVPRNQVRKDSELEATGAANIFSLLHIIRDVCEYQEKIFFHTKRESRFFIDTPGLKSFISPERNISAFTAPYWGTLNHTSTLSSNSKNAFRAPETFEYTISKILRHIAAEKISVNTRDFDLSGCDLEGLDLRYLDLHNATFAGSNLTGAILISAKPANAAFQNADLSSAIMHGCNLTNTDLRNAVLTGANLDAAHIKTSQIKETDFTAANFQTIYVKGKGTGSEKHYSRSQFLKQFYPKNSTMPQKL